MEEKKMGKEKGKKDVEEKKKGERRGGGVRR